MPIIARFLIVVAGLHLVASCAGQSVVVLVADPDGKVGQAAVATQEGEQQLSEANQMTVVTAADHPPSATTVASAAFIEQNFAAALSAQPQPPAKFLLYFLPGSSVMDRDSQALIPAILAAITQRHSRDIGIHGHSDRVGLQQQNDELSLARARAVRDLLLQHGVAAETLEIASHGEGNPLVETADEVPEPRNRRVEVVVR